MQPDEGDLRFRSVKFKDIDLLRSWDEKPHVIASNPNDSWDWEEDLSHDPDWREQLIAELDGRPIGFVQIIDPALEETHYWGDVPHNLRAIDIWIGEEDCLNKGYGTQMMQMALKRCFDGTDVTAVLIDPLAGNTKAHRFYQRLGFEFTEQRRFGSDVCFVHTLTRSKWQQITAK